MSISIVICDLNQEHSDVATSTSLKYTIFVHQVTCFMGSSKIKILLEKVSSFVAVYYAKYN